MSEFASEKVTVEVPPLCPAHFRDLIRDRLKIPNSGEWKLATVACSALLFAWVTGDRRFYLRTRGDSVNMNIVLAEIGCLACYDRAGYRSAIVILRKGLDHAMDVVLRSAEDPDWPVKERAAALPELPPLPEGASE